METKIPTIGRIVVYNTTEAERTALKALNCNQSSQLPAIIVSTWGDQPGSAVNLKVIVDGPANDLWKTSLTATPAGEEGKYPEGTWHWPVTN